MNSEIPRLHSKKLALRHFSQVEADKGNDEEALELLEAAAEIEDQIEELSKHDSSISRRESK